MVLRDLLVLVPVMLIVIAGVLFAIFRNLGGVTPFGFADALVGRTGSATTIFDTAVVESDPNNGSEGGVLFRLLSRILGPCYHARY